MITKKKSDKPEIVCDVKHEYGYLDESKSKLVAEISWGKDDEPTLDIRKCYTSKDGERHIMSGIRLKDDELDTLVEFINEHKKKKKRTEGVNFDDIFAESSDITDKRAQGYRTEDGFMTLKKKPGVSLK